MNTLDSEIMKEKSSFVIYADLESLLMTEDNGKSNTNESYTSKY